MPGGQGDALAPLQAQGISGTAAGVNPTLPTVVTVQGDPAGIPIPVTASISPPALQDVNLTQVGGVPVTDPLPVDIGAGPFLVDINGQPISVGVVNFPATQPISGTVAVSNFPATQPISAAALPLPAGASTEATLAALNAKITNPLPVSGTVTATVPNPLPISAAALPLPAGASTEATLAAVLAILGAGLPTALVSGKLNVIQTEVPNATTATVASVADQATSTTLLASSGIRMGATFYNDSTETLYLKFGATASATDYTVKLVPQAYYELPQSPLGVYSGVIDGIWSANGSGACKVTSW